MSTEDLIAEVKALDAAAEKGPWCVAGEYVILANGDGIVADAYPHNDTPVGSVVLGRGVGRGATIEDNLTLIASYRTLAPKLAKLLEAALAEVDKLRAECGIADCSYTFPKEPCNWGPKGARESHNEGCMWGRLSAVEARLTERLAEAEKERERLRAALEGTAS